jgi:hypothetical protein
MLNEVEFTSMADPARYELSPPLAPLLQHAKAEPSHHLPPLLGPNTSRCSSTCQGNSPHQAMLPLSSGLPLVFPSSSCLKASTFATMAYSSSCPSTCYSCLVRQLPLRWARTTQVPSSTHWGWVGGARAW